jgi:hypothetical protein
MRHGKGTFKFSNGNKYVGKIYINIIILVNLINNLIYFVIKI